MTKEILLTQGKVALVDDEDFEELSRYKWYVHSPGGGRWYAMKAAKLDDGRKRPVSMHRFLMKPPKKMTIDHIDGDGLNNMRSNLRAATNQENCFNSKINSNNSSGFKGVCFFKPAGKFMSYINLDYKHIYLGYYDTAEEAAKVYDEAAKKYHGEFARLNFPELEKVSE